MAYTQFSNIPAKAVVKIEAYIFVLTVCYKTTVILIRGNLFKTLFLSLLNVNVHTAE